MDFEQLPIREVFEAKDSGEPLGLDELRELADALSRSRSATWQVTTLTEGTRWVTTTLGTYNSTGTDWVEVSVSVRSWRTESTHHPALGQRLWTLWVDLSVACWCEPNHNSHPVREHFYEVGSPAGLAEACNMALTSIEEWLAPSLSSDSWRRRAGLPLMDPDPPGVA